MHRRFFANCHKIGRRRKHTFNELGGMLVTSVSMLTGIGRSRQSSAWLTYTCQLSASAMVKQVNGHPLSSQRWSLLVINVGPSIVRSVADREVVILAPIPHHSLERLLRYISFQRTGLFSYYNVHRVFFISFFLHLPILANICTDTGA